MRRFESLSLAVLLSSAAALVVDPQPRGSDRCYQSVFDARGAVAQSDCASYYRETVSLCPITVTSTYTSTVSSGTTTVTHGRQGTTTVTSSSTVVSTSTLTSIATSTSTTLDVVSTALSTSTATSTTETTVDVTTTTTAGGGPTTTVYGGPGAPQKKRDVHTQDNMCLPSTICPTHIPSYATSCGGYQDHAGYSSACSCYGATRTRTTVWRSTSTYYKTTRTTVPATVTAHNTGKATSTVVVTVPTVITATAVSTDVSTVTDSTTSTSGTVVTTTVTSTKTDVVSTVTEPAPTTTIKKASCALSFTSSYYGAGYFGVQGTTQQQVRFVKGQSDAVDFALNNNNELMLASAGVRILADPSSGTGSSSYLFVEGPVYVAGGMVGNRILYPLMCTVHADDSISCTLESNPSDDRFDDAFGTAGFTNDQTVSPSGPFGITPTFDCSF